MISLYFKLNCVIKLNMVLPKYWLFGPFFFFFDRTMVIVEFLLSPLLILQVLSQKVTKQEKK